MLGEIQGELEVGNDWGICLSCTVCMDEVLKGGMEERKREEVIFDSYKIFLHYTYQLGFVHSSIWKHLVAPPISALLMLSISSLKSVFVTSGFLFCSASIIFNTVWFYSFS